MLQILITTAVFSAVGVLLWKYMLCPSIADSLSKNDKHDNNAVYIVSVMLFAFIARIICAVIYKGHATDVDCFAAWSGMLFDNGLPNFYTSEAFHDYPPGYMYILYIIGAIKHLFNPSGSPLYLLIKFPAIVIDMLSGFFIYKAAKKYSASDALASIMAAMYLFNPAIILNSSLWGQVDTVYTILIALMIYMISEKKLIQSYFIFAAAIFVKPQAFIFTPLVIYGIVEHLLIDKEGRKQLPKNILAAIGAILAMVVAALPFGFTNIVEQYKTTLASYPYLTVNAFNIWGAFGKNWTGLTPATSAIGYIILVLIVAYSTYIFFKSKNSGKYFFVGALLSFSTFMLSTKMHERYAFPAMLLLLLAFMRTKNPKEYLIFVLVSLSQFFNTAWVLFVYGEDINYHFRSPVVNIASIINIAIFVYIIFIAQKEYAAFSPAKSEEALKNLVSSRPQQKKAEPAKEKKPAFTLSKHFSKLNKTDWIALAVIIIVYSCVALHDLGDMNAPETEVSLPSNTITADLGEDTSISQIKFYLGSYELNDNRPLNIEFRDSSNNVTASESYTKGSVFYWSNEDVNTTARYITLSTTADKLTLKEFAVMDNSNNLVTPVSVSGAQGLNIADEQSLVPERTTFRNSTYFDEIYHARTAYEFVHSLSVYEWTHPPLGKVFISIGIRLFGMCPFGWRIIGTLFGIFMIPAIYLFAKRLFDKSWLSIVTCLLFTFDFMHFAQTRIATIDVYVTFFIILMYYFMYKYFCMSFYDTPLKKTFVPLALSGICMGLGIACKWTGIYAGAGLCVLFFITVYKRYSEYRYAVQNPNGSTDSISHKRVIEEFKPNLLKTLGWCCIFFIGVPLVIYCLSYIPYLNAPDSHGLKTIIDNQNSMYTYHAKTVLGSTHPYSSRWYEWLIMRRPIWYYSGTVSDSVKEGISSFGNPLVWWVGIPAFLYMVYTAIKRRDKISLFFVIAYLAQLVSWIPVTRLTFIYHYFPCVPFIVLMIGYSINLIYQSAKDDGTEKTMMLFGFIEKVKIGSKKSVIIGAFIYAGLAVVLFAMFYPVLSGRAVSVDYVKTFLKWFNDWVLI